MNNQFKNSILEFVRWDGPSEAPIYFLTMEDGIGFNSNELKSKKSFYRYFKNIDANWLPNNTTNMKTCGRMGQRISKIMTVLLNNDTKGWRQYMNLSLYKKNEANIKFYPIARYDARKWNIKIQEYTGLKIGQYEMLCKKKRIDIFLNKNRQFCLSKDKFYIIADSKAPWINVLKKVFGDLDASVDEPLSSKFTENHHQHTVFYYNKDHKLVAAECNLNFMPLKNDTLVKFAREIRRRGLLPFAGR